MHACASSARRRRREHQSFTIQVTSADTHTHTHTHIQTCYHGTITYAGRELWECGRRTNGRTTETPTCVLARMEIYRHASATQQATVNEHRFSRTCAAVSWNISISCFGFLRVTCYVWRSNTARKKKKKRKQSHSFAFRILNSEDRERERKSHSPYSFERFQAVERDFSLAIMRRSKV